MRGWRLIPSQGVQKTAIVSQDGHRENVCLSAGPCWPESVERMMPARSRRSELHAEFASRNFRALA